MRAAITGLLPALALTFAACSTHRGGAGTASEIPGGKVTANAARYQARFIDHGKPTTFELELYQTDTVIGIYGRGYLGKGALRGRLTQDSLEVYFPTTKEYLRESLTDLVQSSDCPLPIAELNLLDIFRTLPDSLTPASGITAVCTDSGDRPRYTISSDSCGWQIEVEYRHRNDAGWGVDSFEFADGGRYRFWARLKRFRADASVKAANFHARPDTDAVRIRPRSTVSRDNNVTP